MPLGGQHITAALVKLRNRNLKLGSSESALPLPLRVVRGTIYGQGTPLEACRAVAGQHQSTQHDVRESTMADTCSYILEMEDQKAKQSGAGMLTDNAIYSCLQSYGLICGSDKSMQVGDKEMTTKEATTIQRQQVYLSIPYADILVPIGMQISTYSTRKSSYQYCISYRKPT